MKVLNFFTHAEFVNYNTVGLDNYTVAHTPKGDYLLLNGEWVSKKELNEFLGNHSGGGWVSNQVDEHIVTYNIETDPSNKLTTVVDQLGDVTWVLDLKDKLNNNVLIAHLDEDSEFIDYDKSLTLSNYPMILETLNHGTQEIEVGFKYTIMLMDKYSNELVYIIPEGIVTSTNHVSGIATLVNTMPKELETTDDVLVSYKNKKLQIVPNATKSTSGTLIGIFRTDISVYPNTMSMAEVDIILMRADGSTDNINIGDIYNVLVRNGSDKEVLYIAPQYQIISKNGIYYRGVSTATLVNTMPHSMQTNDPVVVSYEDGNLKFLTASDTDDSVIEIGVVMTPTLAEWEFIHDFTNASGTVRNIAGDHLEAGWNGIIHVMSPDGILMYVINNGHVPQVGTFNGTGTLVTVDPELSVDNTQQKQVTIKDNKLVLEDYTVSKHNVVSAYRHVLYESFPDFIEFDHEVMSVEFEAGTGEIPHSEYWRGIIHIFDVDNRELYYIIQDGVVENEMYVSGMGQLVNFNPYHVETSENTVIGWKNNELHLFELQPKRVTRTYRLDYRLDLVNAQYPGFLIDVVVPYDYPAITNMIQLYNFLNLYSPLAQVPNAAQILPIYGLVEGVQGGLYISRVPIMLRFYNVGSNYESGDDLGEIYYSNYTDGNATTDNSSFVDTTPLTLIKTLEF